jgi:hypothetical protein
MRLALEIFLWRHGRLWMLLAAATILLLASVPGVLTPLKSQLLRIQQERISATHQLTTRAVHDTAAQPVTRTASLETTLPSTSERDRTVRAIYRTADQHNLSYSSSALRTTDYPTTGVSRTEVTLPVRGTYPQLVGFVETLLRDHPHVSVDRLLFRRDSSTTAVGDADIRISCWTRRASGTQAAQAPRADQQLALERLVPRSDLFPAQSTGSRRDLFSSASQFPPVNVAVDVPVFDEPPSFIYVGRKFDGMSWEVYLTLDDRTYIAKAGGMLDDHHQVESIGTSRVTITDLRTSQVQTISTGD